MFIKMVSAMVAVHQDNLAVKRYTHPLAVAAQSFKLAELLYTSIAIV